MQKLLPLLLLLTAFVRAVEPWADDKLPVKDGLELWLDANTEDKATADTASPKGAAKPGLWHDGSGHKRDAKQPSPEACPKWTTAYPMRTFSFDGQSQHFVVNTDGWTLREATVVVFARANSNTGGYRGLIAASKPGGNDYTSGFNIDFGNMATDDNIGALNVEGAGFHGEKNLLRNPLTFGATFSTAITMDAQRISTYVNGRAQNTRVRSGNAVLNAGQILIGARSWDNTGGKATPHGFLHGDVFEVLIYNRALPEEEIRAVSSYFTAKYASIVFVAPPKIFSPHPTAPLTLVPVKNPPLIQPLVPGFTTRKLPIQLTNLNYLRYRPDGRLYAGAYNGKIYVLRDTDGDGMEDKAELFYESKDLSVIMGMALTPPNYPRGEGVFVATRGRILLILDKDGKGGEVITVAQGWEPPKRMGGGVADTIGIAVAPDNSIYFGVSCSDFTNAYLLDPATGKPAYTTATDRGTIQHVSADFSKREAVCSGIRFTVDMQFNRAGDLIATEQEGATWMPNGNPFDELLHIQTGKHYGFPPYHPQYLSNVVDEPSVFDYGPQHQSTVGLCFNEPVKEGAPIFGPAWWRGDALVAAMSRGKIYRTKLVKTAAGYVAENDTFAQLHRIIINQAVSPNGALTFCLHSGAPDWGTGPTGTGDLWQFVPNKEPVPQPVLAWSASPTEFRVGFDAPIPPAALAAMQDHVRIFQGRYVQAGDRFETMRPGYQVVKNQMATPRYPVAVQKISLADNNRTLVIATPPRSAAVCYGISIEIDAFKSGDAQPYAGQIDLLAELTGLEAEFTPEVGAAVKTWLPHPDLDVSRAISSQSAPQAAFFEALGKFGKFGAVSLHGQFDLSRMLYPEIQAGSKLTWEYPPEQVTVVIEAARPFQFTLGEKTAASALSAKCHSASIQVTTKTGTWLPFNIAVSNGTDDPRLSCHWFTDRSPTPRAFPLRRILLPYALPQDAPTMPRNEDLPQLAGAKLDNGLAVFKKNCAVCHTHRGEGGRVGPDLSNLIFRDYDSVLRDIRDPSASINPDHVGYAIKKKDGLVLNAVLLAENTKAVTLAQTTGEILEIQREDIAIMKQLPISLMPEGFDKALPPDQLRDLLAFLLLPPGSPLPSKEPK